MKLFRFFTFILVLSISIQCFAKTSGWEGTKLRELTDVDQQSEPTDGDTVVWNDTLKLWEFSAGGGGGGYTNLTEFVAQTAWRSFYSDGSGDVKELAFGDAGKILTSNGASSAPSWETPAVSSQWSGTAGSIIYYNSANVGVGTSTPATALSVNGVITATGGNSTTWNSALQSEVDGSITNELPVAGNDIDISGSPASTVDVEPELNYVTKIAPTGNLELSPTANVGIGISNPSEKLEVSGGYIKGNLQTNVGIGKTNPATALDVNGDITCSTLNYSALSPAINVGTGTANYVSKWLTTSTLQDSSIFDNGNVGIGTTNPLTKLSISGDETITGDILMASTKGLKINENSAGYAISYDGVNGTTTIINKSALHPASKQITVDVRLKFSGTVPTSQQLIYLDGTVGQARTECTIESLAGGYGVLGFSDGTENYYGSTSLEWVVDTWYILRYTWDGNLTTGNIKAYRDGTLYETWDGDNPFPSHNSDAWLAALPEYGLYNRMVLDEVRVSDIIRTDSVTSSTKFVSDANTVLLLHMDDSVGINVTDSSSNNFTVTNSGGTSWVEGQVPGGTVDKNLIKRTSASTVTNPGTLSVGYSGDSILLKGNTGIGTNNTGLASLSVDTVRIGTGTSSGYVLTAASNGVGTWQATQGTITGSGSAASIPKFATSSSLANSIMSESGTTIAVGGGVSLTESLSLLTNNTGISMSESVAGTALSFNGSSDSLTTTYKSALNLTGARTYECWFQDPSPSVGTKIYMSRNGDFMLGINNTDTTNWNVYFFDGTSENYLTGVGAALSDGVWHHLAVTWDRTLGSNQLKAYVDGALWAQATDTNAYKSNTNDLKFSIHQNGSNFYPSIQDEIRISDTLRYTGTFTPTTTKFTNDANTVLLLHLDEGSGNPADSSSNSFTNTLVDAPDYVTGNVIGSTVSKSLINRNSSNTYLGYTGESVRPSADNTIDLGSPTYRWANGYFGGNVGIGNTAPAQALDVTGSIEVSGNINIPITTSTVGQIKQNNAPLLHTYSSGLFLGVDAGNLTMSGTRNTSIGSSTLQFLTSGNFNTAVGDSALNSNNTGTSNSATGIYALYSNLTGDENTANGIYALYGSLSGNNNTSVGVRSLYNVESGNNNTALGYQSGYNIDTNSSGNVFLGYASGPASTSTVSNKLYIDNSANDTPLIYGDFTNNILQLWGNVGIGTSAPSQYLDVAGKIRLQTGASNGYVLTSDATGVGSWAAATGGVGGSGTTNYVSKFSAGTTLANSQIFDNATNIGIGTTAPKATFDIYKAAGSNTSLILGDGDVAHGVTTLAPTTAWLLLNEHTTEKGGAQLTGFSDATDNPAIEIKGVNVSDPDNGIPAIILDGYSANGTGTQALAAGKTVVEIQNNGSALVSVLGNGNVGIGITTPTKKLDVNGGFKSTTILDNGTNVGIGTTDTTKARLTTDTFRVITGASNGYYLKSDSNGVGTWAAVTSGTIGGSGTTNYISKWSDGTNLTDSVIFDNGTNVGIGTTAVTLAAFNTPTIRIGTSTTTGYVLTASNTGIGTWQAVTGGTGGVTPSKSFTLTNPSSATDGAIWRTPAAITITAVHGVCEDGTNIIGHLDECDVDGKNCAGVDGATDMTITTSNVNDDGSLSNASIDAGDYVGWHTTSVSGSVTKAIITYDYEE